MSAWEEKMGWVRSLFHETVWEAAGPVLRLGFRCGARAVVGALLAGAALGGQPLFLPVGWTAACGGGVLGLAALVGSMLGSILFWGPLGALEQTAAALLCFCARFVLRSLPVSRRRWMAPICAAATAFLLAGAAFWAEIPSAEGVAIFLLRSSLPGLLAAAYQRSDALGQIVLYGTVVLGAAPIPLPEQMKLGGVIASFWAASSALGMRRSSAAAAALAGGAALELAGGEAYPLILGLAALSSRTVRREEKHFCAAMFLAAALCASLLFGERQLGMALELSLGTLLAILIPKQLTVRQQTGSARQRQLHLAADGLRALARCVEQREADSPGDAAALYDRAAEQVCRVCANFPICWEQNAAQTTRALAQLSTKLLNSGHIRRDELPEDFLDSCRRPEAFTAALNHQLELRLCHRQGAVRLEELRQIQATRTAVLARLLDELAAPEAEAPPEQFRAVMGAAAAARNGEVISGDAGAYCKGPDGRVYLLVCDGMGTGAGAARLSHAAVDALSALLQSGAQPEDALALLGGTYLLRGDGAFSTVDLAAIDLRSGEATIYKWGAAPSYLVTNAGIKRVGTATIPPGVSADETLAAETVRLSLGKGEVLVLISDGAGGTETERLLGAYDGCAPRELADRVVRAAQTRAAVDDMTAAALRLERVQ